MKLYDKNSDLLSERKQTVAFCRLHVQFRYDLGIFPYLTLVMQRILEGAGHGFALNKPKFNYWGDEYVKWIKSL